MLSPEEESALQQVKRQLEEDLQLRSMQIADLQQKIADSDQENKGKNRWESLQSMLEAKSALKYLFELAADAKKELIFKTRHLSELEDALRNSKDEADGFQENIRQLTARHQKEIDQLEREHQTKVFMLLNQLRGVRPESGDKMLQERIQILEQSFEQLEVLQKRLEEREAELISVHILLDQRNAELERLNKKRGSNFRRKHESKMEISKLQPKIETSESEEDSNIDDPTVDPDWQKTPIFRKIQKLKHSSYIPDMERGAKRSADGQTKWKCNCKGKGKCLVKKCSCRKGGVSCGQDCHCVNCQNRDENEDRKVISKLTFAEDSSFDCDDLSSLELKRSRTLSSIENTMDNISSSRADNGHYFAVPKEPERDDPRNSIFSCSVRQ